MSGQEQGAAEEHAEAAPVRDAVAEIAGAFVNPAVEAEPDLVSGRQYGAAHVQEALASIDPERVQREREQAAASQVEEVVRGPLGPTEAADWLLNPEDLAAEELAQLHAQEYAQRLESGELVQEVANKSGEYERTLREVTERRAGLETRAAREAVADILEDVLGAHPELEGANPEVFGMLVDQAYTAAGGEERFAEHPAEREYREVFGEPSQDLISS